jgi:hypothetical protein
MKRALFLSMLACLGATTASPARHDGGRVTTAGAKALVMAALTTEQRRLPRLEAEAVDAPNASRFLFFTVIWEGRPRGSVVVGNYAVDSYTADVFSATASCYEESNGRLRALQQKLRADLHLSRLQYRRLKTKGPLCEDGRSR